MILVTGATGFLGSELVKQLISKGERVRAIKRETSLIPAFLENETAVEWFNADLVDYFTLKETMVGVDKVYHCAAFISFDPADKKIMRKVNVEGTVNLLNVCMEMNISRFLHVSSVAALGESKKGALITEKDQWEYSSKSSYYSITKFESEMEVFRACAEGLNAVIINPSIIIGKNAGNQGSGKLFETVKKGLNYYPGGSFGYVDVEDVAKSMILLMESDISDERFIVNAENWTYQELFSEIARNFGKKAPQIGLRPWVMNLAYMASRFISVFTGKKQALTKETISSAFKKRNFSNEKIKKTLNLEFKPIKESIRQICEHF